MRQGKTSIVHGFDYEAGQPVSLTRAQWKSYRENHERAGGTVARFKDGDAHTTNFHVPGHNRPWLAREAYGL